MNRIALLLALLVTLIGNEPAQAQSSLSKQSIVRLNLVDGPTAARADALETFRSSGRTASLLENLKSLSRSPASRSVGAASRTPVLPLTTGAMKPLIQLPSNGTVAPRLDFKIARSENGTASWMRGQLGNLPAAKRMSDADLAAATADLLNGYAGLLKLKQPSAELSLTAVNDDAIGFRHVRFQQTFEGIPVWGRDLIAHLDRGGQLYAINGSYEPTPELNRDDLDPALSPSQALERVVADLRYNGRWNPLDDATAEWLGLDKPTTELVVYPGADGATLLAYDVTLHASLVEYYTFIVDARAGAILNRIERHCTLHPPSAHRLPDNVSLARRLSPTAASGSFSDATATDLNGQSQTMRVYQDDGGEFLLFSDLDNVGSFQIPNLPEDGGAVTITANNSDLDRNAQLSFVTSTNNTWSDPVANSAHINQALVYDYFKTTFGRRAINDADQSLVSVVRVTQGGQPMDNAYFNGRMMAYGDGNQAFTPLAGALDVAAHEMAHGVIAATADLIYQAQPGALNESFADVFGAMVDRDDYLMGEDIMRVSRAALRDLESPGNPNVLSPQPAHMSEFEQLPNTAQGDNGGVHINSGIPNRAAVIVAETIGKEKTEQIYYRALTTYLTRNSQFGDARQALEQAAVDLHGAESPEHQAIQTAFDTVGIGGGTNVSDPDANDVPAVSGENSIVAFVIADGSAAGVPDGTIAFMNPFVEGFSGIFTDANAVARVGSQLSTPLDGSAIWFVNANRQIAAIDLSQVDASDPASLGAAPVLVAEDFNLFQPGDIANVVIGPIGTDENGNLLELLAIASAYEEDPTLYFTDLTEIIPIDLKPETTQQGIDNDLIKYPDVIAWSPNPFEPKVAFDALNAVPFFSFQPEYWSIYEIDFGVEQIYNLVASQPAGVSVGNIAYSSLNPDFATFNVVAPNQQGVDEVDVYLADYEAGQLQPLALPALNPPIQDAFRPTFAPDDAFLLFPSEALNALLFLNLESRQISSLGFGAQLAPFGPTWFIAGADVGDVVSTGTESEELPFIDGLALENYPNPFATGTTIRVGLEENRHVRLTIYDMLGRVVEVLVDETLSIGTHEIDFGRSDLAPGTYLARLETGDLTVVRPLTRSR